MDPVGLGGIGLGESESGDVSLTRELGGLTSVELCAGAGGQALGLHNAGFVHVALVELDRDACSTLRHNGRPWGWAECVNQADIRTWRPPAGLGEISLVSAGVPCPPFSIAGKQLGKDDERDLFPALLNLVEILSPRAVQAENVRGLLSSRFDVYRDAVEKRLTDLGYLVSWRLLNACDHGVSQLRPRTVMVALRPGDAEYFTWPEKSRSGVPTVGQKLLESMSAKGWEGAAAWAELANGIAPTLVGGSRKHGGPDLGPTRARVAWAGMGVDGRGISDHVPGPGFKGMPKLTVEQAAILQGFPTWWEFQGRKTSAYRQVGNAFPPPVAEVVGRAVAKAIAQGRADEVAA
jgi:DNA (cytosine-5)-methyltransferase 1